jgi:hypothetical protein
MLLGADARADLKEDIDKAVERGVDALRQMQTGNGTWTHNEIGATALAGLTLLECGVKPDDKAVQKAAGAVREAGVKLTHTYSLSLSILFLDRLGDPEDIPLIESMTVRLLAGQTASGGWSYHCPDVSPAEVKRLTDHLRQRNELVGRRELPKEGRVTPKDDKDGKEKTEPRRTAKDLPKEIQDQLALINRQRPGPGGEGHDGSDNSNTQFASLALWVAHRYGLPVEPALDRIGGRFRASQNGDGGWDYHFHLGGERHGHSTATMTAAGLLGLAVAHGAAADMAEQAEKDAKGGKEGKGKPKAPDIAKDVHLKAGLVALGSSIDHPAAKRKAMGGPGGAPQIGGKAYYFLWSLERVAVILGLDTVGGKDWYTWGAEVLLANQQRDGTWSGEYGANIDTCFALLFLKRSNLARDLTGHLRGKLEDPSRTVLKAGGVGGDALTGGTPGGLKPALDPKDPKESKETARPAPRTPEEAAVAKLTDELVQAPPGKEDQVLETLRDGKGAKYTEALAGAIPQLEGNLKRKAREALADRLSRMKDDTLGKYLKDDLPEIRRAAAVACGMKETKAHVSTLIEMLRDPEPVVVRGAHAALKALSGQDFGPATGADDAEIKKAVAAWQSWWEKQKKE